MPRVSFVVTVFDKAPYLPTVVAGLAAQRGDFEREFVFVNDGSRDESLAVLEQATAGWPARRIIDQPNRGPSAALNAGLRAADGDFVKPVDGDDVLTPNATASLLEALAATGAGFAYGAAGAYRAADGMAAVLAQAAAAPSGGQPEPVLHALMRTLRSAQTTPSSWLARGELARKGCDPEVYVQDYSIELRMAHETAVARIPDVIYLRPELAPGRMSEQEAQTLHDVNLAIAHFLARESGLAPEVRRYAMRRTAGRAWSYARRHAGKGYFSREFRRYLAARLGMARADAAAVARTCEIFRATAAIKLMR